MKYDYFSIQQTLTDIHCLNLCYWPETKKDGAENRTVSKQCITENQKLKTSFSFADNAGARVNLTVQTDEGKGSE